MGAKEQRRRLPFPLQGTTQTEFIAHAAGARRGRNVRIGLHIVERRILFQIAPGDASAETTPQVSADGACRIEPVKPTVRPAEITGGFFRRSRRDEIDGAG